MSMDDYKVFIDGTQSKWKKMDRGVHMQVLGHADDIMMTCVKFGKDAVGSLHSHPHRQVSYIISGSFEVEIGEKKEILTAGDCYLVPADIVHGVVALEDDSRLVDVFTPARDDLLEKFRED